MAEKKTKKTVPETTGPSKSTTPIPTLDRVLITRVKPETVSAGGIIIPEMAVEDETKGYVVATGPLVGKTERSTVAVGEPNRYPVPGDTVFFGQYAGTPLPHNGVEYLIMRESDIMAILP